MPAPLSHNDAAQGAILYGNNWHLARRNLRMTIASIIV